MTTDPENTNGRADPPTAAKTPRQQAAVAARQAARRAANAATGELHQPPGPARRKAATAALSAEAAVNAAAPSTTVAERPQRPARPRPPIATSASEPAPQQLDDMAQISPSTPQDTAHFAAGPVDLLTPAEERLFSRTTRWSFVALVVMPVLAAFFYLLTVAADRYAVEVKFAVRSPSGLPTSDLIGMVTGGAAGTTRSDSYMVVEYLQSRQFLDEISTRLDLPAIYAIDSADPLMRLSDGASKEDTVDYLARVVRPSYDATAEIITVEAQAFSPDDALRVANSVLETVGAMVNRLSEQARQDTVRLAEAEVARAEAALRAQRNAIGAFRETEQSIDPNQSVATQETVLRTLQGQLATARAEMRSLREFLSPEAPSIRVLSSQIASIENQIAQERANLGAGRGQIADSPQTATTETLNSAVTLYEALAVDLEFHERTYVSALSSLEAARVEADRQQRYLAAVVLPALPESAAYPRLLLSLALVFAVCFFTWGILSMFVHVIREHMR